MVYTEVREVGRKKKYYRVFVYRKKGKVAHIRKYLGSDLDIKTLNKKEKKADMGLGSPLNMLLSKKDKAALEEIKRKHQAKHPLMFENRYEAFVSEFTYDSTGIEGNTLTLRETAAVLFEGATPAKSLREVYEVLNHKKAFDYIVQYEGDVTKQLLCKLQKMVTENTLRPEIAEQAGKYRTVPVFIRGATITPPPPEQVPKEMRSLIAGYGKNKKVLHPAVLAAYMHAAFEAIHPFIDGNGRTGRLLLNFILHKNSYPMISIPRAERMRYFEALAKAQKGNLKHFLNFIIKLLKNTEKSI